MKVAPLFLKLSETEKKFVVAQGGGDAAKTVSILQRLAIKRIERPRSLGTVVARTIPAVKQGALYTFQKYVQPDLQKYIIGYNESERYYTFYNKSKLHFTSFENEISATGSERDDLFINECNHIPYQIFWQAQRKTHGQVFLDYNPTSPFWVHEKILPTSPSQEGEFKNKIQYYRVWHEHNPYLTDEQHDSYENITDKDLFDVYSRGITGKITGLIFGHFKKWTGEWPDDCDRVIWGIDYGYTNDPTAIVKIAVGPGRRRVAKELIYEPGVSADTIKNVLLFNGLKQTDAIYSEADPNMINQLRALGMPVYPAIKGPGSIAAGLSKIREHECYYTSESLNFEKEVLTYKWMTAQDIQTGKEVMTNVPIDAWNHLCDAFRMADYTDSIRHKI